MDTDILTLVIGDELQATHSIVATLPGYRSVQLPNESFPILQPDTNASCHGILLSGLSELAYQRIRFFEGDEYELQLCSVSTGNGPVTARYCADTTHPDQTLSGWSLSDWQTNHKEHFCKRVESYMKLFGTLSTTEADKYWLASDPALVTST